jgi:3-oxoacyl-(acyl-carrier-protein) synthase
MGMSRVFVSGLGAVSPAGWSVPAMRAALEKGVPLPVQSLERPGWDTPLRARFVPNPTPRPAFLAHPRLRRTSAITHYAVSSALEAVARLPAEGADVRRLGVVVCLQSGCVQFSYRFFEETVKDPATASPLLFPETVFAAPASHVATLLGNTPLVCTLIGDAACFLQGLALGVQWLMEDRVDACLIIGAEETNWLLADALWHFQHAAVISGGAGAVCLSLNPACSMGVELCAITDAHTYAMPTSRIHAAHAMRAQLPACSPGKWLFDGLAGSPRADGPELAAWRDWTGPRLSPKRILGEGLMAAGAWQCVAACDAVVSGQCSTAIASLVGANQQAVGALFARPESGIPLAPDLGNLSA